MVQARDAALSEPDSRVAESRRREILAAASRLFRARGLAGTGMRDIAAELNLTAGSLYYYFRSKQDLLAYCQRATLDELLRGAREILERRESVAVRIARFVDAHLVCLNQTYPGSLAHLEVGSRGAGSEDEELHSKRRDYERLLVRLLSEGVGDGSLRACNPRLTALALLGSMNWTVQWFDPEGELGAREVAAEFARLFLDGLQKERT